MPGIPEPGRLRQKDYKFQASLNYTERHQLKKINKSKEKQSNGTFKKYD
jgi:hypothetical protein